MAVQVMGLINCPRGKQTQMKAWDHTLSWTREEEDNGQDEGDR